MKHIRQIMLIVFIIVGLFVAANRYEHATYEITTTIISVHTPRFPMNIWYFTVDCADEIFISQEPVIENQSVILIYNYYHELVGHRLVDL